MGGQRTGWILDHAALRNKLYDSHGSGGGSAARGGGSRGMDAAEGLAGVRRRNDGSAPSGEVPTLVRARG
jgi:hypothetical protein